MRLALPAPYPVHTLKAFEGAPDPGHHATWLPRISRILEGFDGFDIHWITCTKRVGQPQTVEERGQTFHLIPRGSLAAAMLTAFRRERRTVARILKALQPDLVHAWGTEEGYGYVATDWRGPSFVSIQGILTVCCRACPQPWLMRFQARHERRVLAEAHFITVESDWGREHLRSLAPHARIELLEYGVDDAFFHIRHRPAKRPLVLFIGTLSRLKGVDVLLEAFQDPRLARVDLALLGDGPLRQSDEGPPPNVRFLGHRPRSEVLDWMARAWCLVHPTRADTSPNVVKEARVAGLPVITTPDGGQTQYVEDGVSGWLVDIGDPKGLVQAILSLVSDPAVGIRMGGAGQEWCRSRLGKEALSAELRRTYRAAIEASASTGPVTDTLRPSARRR